MRSDRGATAHQNESGMSPRGAVTGNATEKQGTYEDDERLSEMIAKHQREKNRAS